MERTGEKEAPVGLIRVSDVGVARTGFVRPCSASRYGMKLVESIFFIDARTGAVEAPAGPAVLVRGKALSEMVLSTDPNVSRLLCGILTPFRVAR